MTFNMRVLHFFLLIYFVSFSVSAAVGMKHLTVNDHLRQEESEGKKVFLSQARKLVSSFATVINQNPAASSMLLSVENQ